MGQVLHCLFLAATLVRQPSSKDGAMESAANLREDWEVSAATQGALAELWQSCSAGELGIGKEDFERLLLGIGRHYKFGHSENRRRKLKSRFVFCAGSDLKICCLPTPARRAGRSHGSGFFFYIARLCIRPDTALPGRTRLAANLPTRFMPIFLACAKKRASGSPPCATIMAGVRSQDGCAACLHSAM